ncbi:hypothetical protein [[Clostridium] symbiosum]|uniref:hypothetical protein n=1 Tax=Clostridium symbiosum TaxID=1512 RepID=UPI0027D45A33|nr:hypothetical protein [[Clostridium] symbiosum]
MKARITIQQQGEFGTIPVKQMDFPIPPKGWRGDAGAYALHHLIAVIGNQGPDGSGAKNTTDEKEAAKY